MGAKVGDREKKQRLKESRKRERRERRRLSKDQEAGTQIG